MKDTLVVISIMLGVAASILLLMPWLIEYMEVYFNFVRSHFNN